MTNNENRADFPNFLECEIHPNDSVSNIAGPRRSNTMKRPRTKRSFVHTHRDPTDKVKLVCAYCKASYVADATSSFKLHLKAKHNIVEKRQKTAVEPTEMITGRGGSRERERLKELLVDLITSNNLRFSLLENKDFRDFVLLLNPGIEGMLTDIARELCAQEEQEEEEEAY